MNISTLYDCVIDNHIPKQIIEYWETNNGVKILPLARRSERVILTKQTKLTMLAVVVAALSASAGVGGFVSKEALLILAIPCFIVVAVAYLFARRPHQKLELLLNDIRMLEYYVVGLDFKTQSVTIEHLRDAAYRTLLGFQEIGSTHIRLNVAARFRDVCIRLGIFSNSDQISDIPKVPEVCSTPCGHERRVHGVTDSSFFIDP